MWNKVIHEIRLALADSRISGILILGGFLYVAIFGSVYLSGRVKQVPLAVCDQDNSSYSRSIINKIRTIESLKIRNLSRDRSEAVELLRTGKVSLVLIIPSRYEARLKEKHQVKILVLGDGSNVLVGNVGLRAIKGLLLHERLSYQSDLLKIENNNPLKTEIRSLYNGTYNYNIFILLGVASIALQQITLVALTTAICLNRTQLKAKFFAYTLISTTVNLFVITVPFLFFGLPLRGSLALVLFITLIYVMIHIFFSFIVADLVKDALIALQLLLYASYPFFGLSGITWPTYAMPAPLSWIAESLPLTNFAALMREICITGSRLIDVWPSVGILIIWAVGLGYFAIVAIRRNETIQSE